MNEWSVVEWCEVAAPGFEGAEQVWVSEADVDRAESACGQAADDTTCAGADRREVGVRPRDDVVDEVVLPSAGPFSEAAVRGRPGVGDDGDEGLGALGDEPVGELGEVGAVDIAERVARHAM